MAVLKPDAIRNIGIIAHIDAGKTTLSERILYYCQKIHRIGEVHDGAATMDFMPEEQERGITIASACTTCQWQNKNINLVDTPGHVDFTIEVERCLRVLDGAIGVFCAVGGVEPQSETVWRQSEDFNIPKLAFINKMDRPGADFQNVLDSIRSRLKANAVPLVVPLGSGSSFEGVLDLLSNEKLLFMEEDQGQTIKRVPFNKDEEEYAAPWREFLFEKLAEADDCFLSLWLEENFSVEDVKGAIKRSVHARTLTPVFCGSALKNIGVQPLLDAITAFLPSPADVPDITGILSDGTEAVIATDPEKPPVGLIFKVLMENKRKTCFLRLYEGTIQEGGTLYNSATGKPARIGRIYRIQADKRDQIKELGAGDIAAVIGFNEAHTGDTYCSKDKLINLEPISGYEPVITLALEPANADEGKILDEALYRYTEEDPTLKLTIDEESGLRMVSGMGELHLEVLLERIAREYGIQPRSGNPQVILRETIKNSGTAEVVFDRELGKERHYGEVALKIEPGNNPDENEIAIGDFLPENEQEARKLLPPVFMEAVREGLQDSLQSGILGGWPVIGVCVTIEQIKKDEGLTTIPGLRMAAAQALRNAMEQANPILLEPLMELDITVPEDFLGPALSLFNQLGGKVENVMDNAGNKLINGIAPLRQLFGFSTKLRSATQGRAGFTMKFRKFDKP